VLSETALEDLRVSPALLARLAGRADAPRPTGASSGTATRARMSCARPATGAFPPFELARSERVYDSYWCGLRRDYVKLADGGTQEYHVFEIHDAVAVVPCCPTDRS
jgi:hypothetical protein